MTAPWSTGTLIASSVLYCTDECLSHRCTEPCGRLAGHGDDFHGCICDTCASAIAGWF